MDTTQLSRSSLLMALGLLTACGGGGGGGGDANRPGGGQASNALTGRFVDGPVAGLRYSTPTQNGVTNSAGEFQYLAGETVTFRVGDIVVGSATGAATVTPFSLAGSTPPVSSVEVNLAVHRANSSSRATPLDIAANIAVFLQTVDADANADNGIQIPDAVHGLATGARLDFAQQMATFYQSPGLRTFVAAGRTAGVWSGNTRAIKHPMRALDTLYAGLGLTPVILSNTQIDFDTGGNNTIDSRVTYAYDANGNRILEQIDRGNNGTPDSIIEKTYDANGNLLSERRDTDGDGTPESTASYSYDANGMLQQEEHDVDGNGTIDALVTYSYNGGGRLATINSDTGANGTIDARTSFTYDGSGNRIAESVDTNADGTPDAVITYAYDADGRLISQELDSDANSIANARTTYSYDANGSLVLEERDTDANGTINTRIRSTYDANGNLTVQETETNGTLTRRVSYAYDAQGNQTSIEIDEGANGSIDTTLAYSYDSNGSLGIWRRTTGSGAVDFVARYSYTPVSNWAAAAWSAPIQ